MKGDNTSLTGWSAIGMYPILAATQMVTALAMSLPITWLINHVFSPKALYAVFASDRLGYWRCVGLFAIWSAATARIKWTIKT
jgi:hypothetical protein